MARYSATNSASSGLMVAVALMLVSAPCLQSSSVRGFGFGNKQMLAAALRGSQPDTNCNSQATTCSSCTEVRNCINFGGQWYNTTSTTCSGKTPWCNEADGAASCVADAPTGGACNTPSATSTVSCTMDGYFPDPTTCTKYVVCVGGTAYAYDCSAFPGTNYDAATSQCRKVGCVTLRCPNPNKATYQLWSTAPWIYSSCIDNKPANALIGACEQGNAWNGTACAPACQKQGRVAVTGDTTSRQYLECVDLGNSKFSSLVGGECPSGTTFNTDAQICKTTP